MSESGLGTCLTTDPNLLQIPVTESDTFVTIFWDFMK